MPRRRLYRRPLTTEDSDPEIQESQDSQAASLLRSETDNLSIFDYDDERSDVDDDDAGLAATFAADELDWVLESDSESISDHGNDNLPKRQKGPVRSRNWRADINLVIEPITLPGCNLNNAFQRHLKTLLLTDLEKVQTAKRKLLYVAFAAKIPSFAEFEAQNRDLVVSALEGHLFLQLSGQVTAASVCYQADETM